MKENGGQVPVGKQITLTMTDELMHGLLREVKQLKPVESFFRIACVILTIWAQMQPPERREEIWSDWVRELCMDN